MAESNGMDRRNFLRSTMLGGAGVTLMGTPAWEAAAQMVSGTTARQVNGVGLDDQLLVQLHINENPLGASQRAIEAVASRMFGMNRYTMHYDLEEALGAHHGVDPETVFTGVGSSEILLTVTLAAYWDRPGNTVTAFPSYRSIPRTTEELGQTVKQVPLTGDWQMDLAAMAAAVDENTRIVSICNPNNPTGQILDADALERTIRAMPKEVIVCVDEAYIQFVDDPDYPSMIPLTKEVENLLVSRTFSKAYGLGGMRVGYGVAHPALLERMQRFSIGMLNKNTLSTAAAPGGAGRPGACATHGGEHAPGEGRIFTKNWKPWDTAPYAPRRSSSRWKSVPTCRPSSTGLRKARYSSARPSTWKASCAFRSASPGRTRPSSPPSSGNAARCRR